MSLVPPRPHKYVGGMLGGPCVICRQPPEDHDDPADLIRLLQSMGPPKREGGQWIASNIISEFVRESAQKKAHGLDWFVNGDGLGWAWVPNGWTTGVPAAPEGET